MKLDPTRQKTILETLANCYPDYSKEVVRSEYKKHDIANIYYLQERGLINASLDRTLDGGYVFQGATITAKGMDFLAGENLSSSEKKIEDATRSIQNTNNFYGPVENSQIAQGNHESSQTISHEFDLQEVSNFIQSLRGQLIDIDISSTQKSEIESDISTLNAQLDSPNPKKSIIKESLLHCPI